MEARQAIEKLLADFRDAYNRGDAAALAAQYTEDCAVLAPNQPPVRGRQAIETFFKGMIEEIGGKASFEFVEVAEAGDLAYEWATYSLEGGKESDAGKAVEIFNRQADGSWKIRLTIFNSDNP